MGLVWVGDRGTCLPPPMFLGVGDKRHFVPMFYRARFFYLVPRWK